MESSPKGRAAPLAALLFFERRRAHARTLLLRETEARRVQEMVVAHPTTLAQVVLNLLRNALKFMPPGRRRG